MVIQSIKEEQDRQKSYVDVHHVDRSYEVVDWVFLRVKLHKSSINFGKGVKMSPRFVEPLKVVEKKGPMPYRIAFPYSLRRKHDGFHVSILRHYVSDPTHVIHMSSLQMLDEGALMIEPIHILDHHIQKLWCLIDDQVKVQWDNFIPHLAT